MRRFTDVGDSLALESGETVSSSQTTGAKVDVRGRPVGTSRLAVAVAMVAERPPKRRVEDGMNAAPTASTRGSPPRRREDVFAKVLLMEWLY